MSTMREADIRPAGLLSTYLRLSAEDARTFFGSDSDRVARPCPGCGTDRSYPAFTKNGFALSTCKTCGSLYVSPAPAADALDAFYRDSPSTRYWANVFFPAVADARRERIFRPRARKIATLLAETDRHVVDVGAGSGLFLEEMRAVRPGTDARAVEPSADLAGVCRDKGIETFEGFAQDAAADPAWAGTADLVTCFEVIEHVLDTVEFVRALGRLVRPGGTVLFTGLCGTGFDIEALGVQSNAVSPPHHLNFLSRPGIAALAERAGLDLIDFSTPGQLDIDIVCNALADDPESVADQDLKRTLLAADAAERRRMQETLVAERRSSHMWVNLRRPAADRDQS